jgi:hypothetical protein
VAQVVDMVYLAPHLDGLAHVAALVPLVGAAAAGLWQWRRSAIGLAFCTTLLAVPLGAEIASDLVTPILLEQTLIWTTLPFYLLVARGVSEARPLAARLPLAAVVLAAVCLDLGGYYRDYRKDAWDEAAAHVAAGAQDGDLVAFVASYVEIPFEYYFRRHPRRADLYRVEGIPVTETSLDELGARAAAHGAVWLVLAHAQFQDPEGRVPAMLRTRCSEKERSQFYRVEVVAFERCR